MNNIITFAYNNTNVRTVTAEDNTPLFCANDVAMILEYSDPKGALDRHCRGVVKHYPLFIHHQQEGEQLMNDITIFNHLGNDIRVMTDGQGEPWFVLKDICDALDIGNSRDVARRLDEDGVDTIDVTDNLGRTQKTNVITEAGLYEVIFMSRKPEAKAFKRWVTSEVLPSIRKHT